MREMPILQAYLNNGGGFDMKYIKRAESIKIEQSAETEQTVKEIIESVREKGDKAVHDYELKFANSNRAIALSADEIHEAENTLSPETKTLIERVVDRVTTFAKAQLNSIKPLEMELGDGVSLGHRIVPIEKVGAYVPGGRFPLLSSGPMVVAPAKAAGASRIVACSPASYKGTIHPAIVYGLVKSGATDIFAIGGAQAIAAMAYGTETVPKVDIIAGPGNQFVAEAKRQVFGQVGIDLIAGPSEILLLADETADPKLLAADLLAQAEHDPSARAILVSLSSKMAEKTITHIEKMKEGFQSSSPAHQSWPAMGEVVVCDSLEEAIRVCDEYAIEHLQLHVKNLESLKTRFTHYGSLFIGEDSSVVFSDKVSGTNHTLPTQRAARYTGGLWAGSYVKVVTHQTISGNGTRFLAAHASLQSDIEGLEGHKLSADVRLEKLKETT